MLDALESPPPPSAPRDRSIAARRAARPTKFEREKRIVSILNTGVAIAEIAAREGFTEKRMRALVQEILARRMPQPPAEFPALQVSRLSEALFVSYHAMSRANLQAVDRVVRIVRQLDRYHGFAAAAPARLAEAPPLGALAEVPLALPAPEPGSPANGAASD